MMKVNAYMCHTIHGIKGKNATKEYMERNCQAAKKLGNVIRERFADHLNLYIPAEHEQFVQKAYDRGYVTEKQVLAVDCDIISTQDLIIILTENGWVGGGIGVEIKHAKTEHLPAFYVDIRTSMDMTWNNLELVLKLLITQKKNNDVIDEQQHMLE